MVGVATTPQGRLHAQKVVEQQKTDYMLWFVCLVLCVYAFFFHFWSILFCFGLLFKRKRLWRVVDWGDPGGVVGGVRIQLKYTTQKI